eukprot:TRINITY_DN340_c0_g1_i4.p1 TRINITY_DN340_c0_g1~~TRINITY_DN340_c0_g1_i4.p1  ORF type:complete len:283 (-),score=52.22 TRINITY_DN340_c0_g1_i4:591-1439(-)
MTSLIDFPDEVLFQVLSSLDTMDLFQCALVCRRLRRLCEDELLWRHLMLRGDDSWKVAEGFRRPAHQPPGSASGSRVRSANEASFSDEEEGTRSRQESSKQICMRHLKASLELGREPQGPPSQQKQHQPWWTKLPIQLSSFWQTQAPQNNKRVLMVGMSKSKLVYQLMWDPHTPLKMEGMEPGFGSGIGSGIKFRMHEKEFSLISVHSLQSIRQDARVWASFFGGASGLIVVLDCDQSTVGRFHSELDAVYDCVPAGIPILHIARTTDASSTAPMVSHENCT